MSKASITEIPFLRFMYFAMAAFLINMVTTNVAGYADNFSNTVYSIGIVLMIGFCVLYRSGNVLLTLLLATLFFNAFFSIFSYLYGMRSLICIYYFPFLVSFIYMFKGQYSKTYGLIFTFICSAFLFSLILFCPMDPTSKIVTSAHVSIMYKKNFILAIVLSFYYFYSIYTFMIGQNKNLQEQKEIAEEASKSKARFLSVMSHELRTPLNGIVGMINLMNGPTTEKENKRFLHILKTSSQHLLQLVNNVLDYSKASAGKMELSPTPCRLDEVLQNTYSVFLPRYNEKNLPLEFSADTTLNETVLLDEVRFVQVMTNLLSNALKFTDQGKVCVEARAVNNSADSLTAEISITDTGKGISEEEKSAIFDSFNNISNKSKKVESTGLGLSISKMIIELMNSELQLDSQPGKGSKFYFSITLPKVQNQLPTRKTEKVKRAESLEGMTVLVAEDNPINMIIAREFLKKWKVNLLEAQNGLIAQAKILEHKDIDLILLDLQMPEMDGYEVMNWIKENNILIPTIAFTANMLAAEERTELLALGFTDMVSKPFAPADLQQRMLQAVQNSTMAV